MGFHQLIHLEGTIIAERLMLSDILIKVIGMERTEQTAACSCLQISNFPVVLIALRPCPVHFYQGIPIDKQSFFPQLCKKLEIL